MYNTPKTKLQCSGYIYTPSFETIKHYFTYWTYRVTKNNEITPGW